jgi:hypothetical protein
MGRQLVAEMGWHAREFGVHLGAVVAGGETGVDELGVHQRREEPKAGVKIEPELLELGHGVAMLARLLLPRCPARSLRRPGVIRAWAWDREIRLTATGGLRSFRFSRLIHFLAKLVVTQPPD